MKAKIAFGIETEYGIRGRKGTCVIDNGQLSQLLVGLANDRYVTAPGHGGCFFENGSLIYVDCGHPEFCTPECSDPKEIVRYLLAQDKIMFDLCRELKKESKFTEVKAFKTNNDQYGTSWGNHESYNYPVEGRAAIDLLVPHLVTRILYTGSGGLEPGNEDNLDLSEYNQAEMAELRRNGELPLGTNEFVISPRAMFMDYDIAEDTMCSRGLIDYREAEDGGCGNRLHLLCGEALCSELASYLRIGTTALVVLMAENGIKPNIKLESPIDTLHNISHDITLQKKYKVRGRKSMSAIQIQEEYLKLVRKHIKAEWMPKWAAELCDSWEMILSELSIGWRQVSTVLDWAIKYNLFQGRLATKKKKINIHKANALEDVMDLWEIDAKFGEVGSGIFYQLDKAKILEHRVPGIVRTGYLVPPQTTRAKMRGNLISRYKNKGVCEWNSFSAPGRRVVMHDVLDPNGKLENFKIGERVRLGKFSRDYEGRTARELQKYVGKVTYIADLDEDEWGNRCAVVEIDDEEHLWLLSDMKKAGGRRKRRRRAS